MNLHLRHLRDWLAVLQYNGDQVTWRTWLAMLRGALAMTLRPLPRAVWWQRARTCPRCPLFDREMRRCAGPWVGGKPTGCGCYLVWMIRVPAPYPAGCWAKQFLAPGSGLGWPAHPPPAYQDQTLTPYR